MKKVILAIVLISIILGFYYYYKDDIVKVLGEHDIHLDIKTPEMPDIKLSESNPFKSILPERTETGDDKLVQAIIHSDGEEVERILASDENGEFIRLFKSLRPEKIYTLLDVVKLNCEPSPVCQNTNRQPQEFLLQCANGMLEMMNSELKKYPSCKKNIEDFYTVTFLCQLKQKQSICLEEDPLDESVEKRSKRLTARGQNTVDCLMSHLDDMNAKNKCIMDAPTHTPEQFEAQLKRYCTTAIACKAFSGESDCIKKYKDLFKDDKQKGKDCTNTHLTSLTQELELLNLILANTGKNTAWGETFDQCTIVQGYEQTIHSVDIFARVKTIQEYTQAMMNELQKTGKDASISLYRLFYYAPQDDALTKMHGEAMMSLNYYNACRIGMLSPK